MKKAITILAICSMLLSGCGQIDDAESKPETTTTTASESTTDTETSSAKEEKDTSEAATTTIKSSQTVSSTSSPTDTTVTTTKKSGSSNANGNSNQVQNNNGQGNNHQENNQPAQNDLQPDNSPSSDPQSNNGAEQNNRPSDNNQNNDPSPPVTTAKPVVTNPPTTTIPKPHTTVPQTEPPAPEPDDQVVDTDALTDQVWVFIEYYPIEFNNMYEKGKTFGGSDFDKAVSILEYANDLGGRNCIEYALNAYFLYQGAGLECGITFASLDEWYGHVANVVKIDGTWYEFDASARKYTENLYFVVKAFDIYENEIIVKLSNRSKV